MAGELSSVTGRLTVHTHSIWNTQKPRNEKNLSRLSSKRSSLPVLRMRKRRKPESRAAHSIRKSDVTIDRAFVVSAQLRVRIAKTTKFEPPAKSLRLH